jgi:hypothetical protein
VTYCQRSIPGVVDQTGLMGQYRLNDAEKRKYCYKIPTIAVSLVNQSEEQ